MKILFLGDVVGSSGRKAISERLRALQKRLGADFTIINSENATSGVGLSAKHASLLLEAGADCLTLGDHAFDQKEMLAHIDAEPRIIRPINLAKTSPGAGARIFTSRRGRKILVAQVLGQVFMKRPYDDPFSAIDGVLMRHKLAGSVDAIVIDIHAEATSEKMAMGHFCDGRASMVIGTHTHVPTADHQIMPSGTAFQSDAGMCGDYNSVIGMDKEEPMRRFVTGLPKGRFVPATREATLSGVLVTLDPQTGRATHIDPVRDGGCLSPSHRQ